MLILFMNKRATSYSNLRERDLKMPSSHFKVFFKIIMHFHFMVHGGERNCISGTNVNLYKNYRQDF